MQLIFFSRAASPHSNRKYRDFQGANVSIPILLKEPKRLVKKITPGSATIEFEETETHNQIILMFL